MLGSSLLEAARRGKKLTRSTAHSFNALQESKSMSAGDSTTVFNARMLLVVLSNRTRADQISSTSQPLERSPSPSATTSGSPRSFNTLASKTPTSARTSSRPPSTCLPVRRLGRSFSGSGAFAQRIPSLVQNKTDRTDRPLQSHRQPDLCRHVLSCSRPNRRRMSV